MPKLDLDQIPQTNATGYPPEHAMVSKSATDSVALLLTDVEHPLDAIVPCARLM